VTRLVARWMSGKPLVMHYRAPEHAFARRYTASDVALLAGVDPAMGTLSGPATACVLRRQRDVFGDARFERLGSISVGHLYNLRSSAGYRQQRVVLTKTQGGKTTAIGVRKAPAPEGRPGFIRIDSVHQVDHDGIKGLYHINAVDCVTQWEVVASVQTISAAHLLPAIEQMLEQFPFEILGFHADNGSEYVNHRVAKMLDSCASSSRAAARATATTTRWPRRRTARWCASSSATHTSRSATPLASTPSAPSTSTRF
jgi:hypothetical protein